MSVVRLLKASPTAMFHDEVSSPSIPQQDFRPFATERVATGSVLDLFSKIDRSTRILHGSPQYKECTFLDCVFGLAYYLS